MKSNMKPGQSYPKKLTNQEPVFDKKLKVHRPRKKKGMGPKWV